VETIKIKLADNRTSGYAGFGRAAREKFWAMQPFAFTGGLSDAAEFLKPLDKLQTFFRFYDDSGVELDHDATLDAIQDHVYRRTVIGAVK
jgi:hypothetical protein